MRHRKTKVANKFKIYVTWIVRMQDNPKQINFFIDWFYFEKLKLQLPAANGDQLTSLISAGHVVQHCSIVDEGIQFTARGEKQTGGDEDEAWQHSNFLKRLSEKCTGGDRKQKRSLFFQMCFLWISSKVLNHLH